MEIDLPEVVAEVRGGVRALREGARHQRCGDARRLCSARTPRTIRYGIGENLYGHEEIAAFRAARSPVGLVRTSSRTVITTYGRDFAVASTLFHRATRARQGRPADADLGALPGRLARRRRARERHRAPARSAVDAAVRRMRIAIDIGGLHAAYAGGLEPAPRRRAGVRRDRRRRRPGIFISLRRPQGGAPRRRRSSARFDPEAKPLWGMPFAVKDNIDVAGLPTTAACPAFAYTPSADATAVARLRAAGALLIGKTNLDQFATGLVGVRTPYRRCRATPSIPTHRAGRVELRLGRRGGARASCRSRSAPTRRARAACRPASTTSSA